MAGQGHVPTGLLVSDLETDVSTRDSPRLSGLQPTHVSGIDQQGSTMFLSRLDVERYLNERSWHETFMRRTVSSKIVIDVLKLLWTVMSGVERVSQKTASKRL